MKEDQILCSKIFTAAWFSCFWCSVPDYGCVFNKSVCRGLCVFGPDWIIHLLCVWATEALIIDEPGCLCPPTHTLHLLPSPQHTHIYTNDIKSMETSGMCAHHVSLQSRQIQNELQGWFVLLSSLTGALAKGKVWSTEIHLSVWDLHIFLSTTTSLCRGSLNITSSCFCWEFVLHLKKCENIFR